MTKDRSLIESKYKWKIDEMYNSQDSINNDIKKVEDLIKKIIILYLMNMGLNYYMSQMVTTIVLLVGV